MTSIAPESQACAENAVELALCRSALYEALALGFRPPSVEIAGRLTGAGARGLIYAATTLDLTPAASAGDDEAAPGSLARLVSLLAETDTGLPALTAAYRRLFGHTVRGASSAYETEYGSDELFQQPRELADLGGFYAAFGLAVAPETGERADHVSCECEFLMVLHRKEAWAHEHGDEAMLAETRKAMRLFLHDHLGRFVPGISERIRRSENDGFYPALAALADGLVRRECARLGITPGPATLRLRSPIEATVPMACGTCPLGGEDDGADAD
jgi:TorA maturation chaperone TorD